MRFSKTAQVSVFSLLILLLTAVVVEPWGEFPLNDDWQYVHVAKQFAETGRFRVDVPVAPTLFIQSALGAGIIQLFGFSFLKLRVLTMVLSGLLLIVLASLKSLAGASRFWMVTTLLCLIVNPLFLHVSQSFMTEIYGALVGFFGVWLWYRSESFTIGRLLAAFVMGSSFWVRQFAVLVFPAVIAAEVVTLVSEKNLKSVFSWNRAAILWWGSLVLTFLLPILVYFPWAKFTGNYSPAFAMQIGRLMKPSLAWGAIHWLILIFYLTAFFSPVLIALVINKNPVWAELSSTQRRVVKWMIALLIVISIALFFRGARPFRIQGPLHSVFPFLANVLSPYGLGPLTLSDTYSSSHSLLPSFHKWPWVLIQGFLIALSWVWVPLLARWKALPLRARKLAAFGLALSALNLVACVQAYGMGVYDRYHFFGLLGVAVSFSVLAGPPPGIRSFISFFAIIGVIGAWVIPAQHDYFAWNRVRWTLLERAEKIGIEARQIDGGFEMNGWLAFERGSPNRGDPECGVSQYWFCIKRPYQISINPTDGRKEIMREKVNSWIGNFPDLLLTGR